MQAADEAEMFLTVPGMGSDHCAGLVTTSIQRLAGISNVITNIAIHRVTVTYQPSVVSADTIKQAVEKAGYEVAGVQTRTGDSEQEINAEERYLKQAWRTLMVCCGSYHLNHVADDPGDVLAPHPRLSAYRSNTRVSRSFFCMAVWRHTDRPGAR